MLQQMRERMTTRSWKLKKLPRSEAVRQLLAFLRSGTDASTSLAFEVGKGGSLIAAPTLRVAALDWLANQPPVDLVMLDISMPDLDGEKVCQELRANPAFDRLKIIAYTAHADSEDSQRYLANGFNAVLIKPISMQRLKDTISGLF